MDVSERQAAINTQIRFHNYRSALPLAYALRLDLQLSGALDPRASKELSQLEPLIDRLERLSQPFWQRITSFLWKTFVEKDPSQSSPPEISGFER